MGLKVKDRAKPKLPPVEPGVYMAVCVGVIYWGWSCYQKDATVSEGTLIAVVRTWL